MRRHRRTLTVVSDGMRVEAAAVWDDHDRLGLTVGDRPFRVEPQGDSDRDVEALLREVGAAGFALECCATSRHFVYAGMGADTGSSIGSCSEGTIGDQRTRSDDTSMTDSCDAFSRGAGGGS